MKASLKQLKILLALGDKKLDLTFVTLKLGKFLLFDGFFDFLLFDFDDFWDLANFWLSDLLVFGFIYFDLLSPSMSATLSIASTLTPSTLSAVSIYDDIVIFSIDISGATILLKPLINW